MSSSDMVDEGMSLESLAGDMKGRLVSDVDDDDGRWDRRRVVQMDENGLRLREL